MMTTTNTPIALALLLLTGGGASAQEPKPDAPRKEEAGFGQPLPLQLQVVLSRYRGDQKLSSLPYTLVLASNMSSAPVMVSNMSSARIRMGVQVPIRAAAEPEKVQYRDVGTNLDCSAARLDAERYRVTCTFEQSSVYSASGTAPADAVLPSVSLPSTPLFRSFRSDSTLILRDGQTGLHTSAADPVSGELLKAEVTLRLIK
jgi:hypothetical protein